MEQEWRGLAELCAQPWAGLAGRSRAQVRDTARAQCQQGAHAEPSIPRFQVQNQRSGVCFMLACVSVSKRKKL